MRHIFIAVQNGLYTVSDCCFQTDCMSTLEKEYDYREEHFDFIQLHIRNFCLKCEFQDRFELGSSCGLSLPKIEGVTFANCWKSFDVCGTKTKKTQYFEIL